MAQGWGKHGAASGTKARGLWLRRRIASLVAIVLVAWLGWLLVRPLLHPRTHLVLLAGDVSGAAATLGNVSADYVVEDLRELLAVEPVLHRGIADDGGPLVLGSLQNPDEMQHLADRLNEKTSGRHDVVLVYVSAHGLTQDGDAWLLASGADPQAPLGGRYRLASLLAQLRECKAATKVLLLDAGRIEYDPLRGLLENDFPTRLVEQVEQLGDPRLWVLVSHADGERSHLSAGLERSVFGYFVAEGLKGAADADRDRSVDLGELGRFVTSGVSGWVRQTTGNASAQTPQLAWGGGDALSSPSPVLIAVPGAEKGAAPQLDHAKSVELARKSSATEQAKDQAAEQGRRELNSLIVSGLSRSTPRGRLGQYVGDAAQRTVSQVIGRAKLPGASTAVTTNGEPAVDEKAPKSEDAKKNVSDKQKEESDDVAAPSKETDAKGGAAAAVADKANDDSKKGKSPSLHAQQSEIKREQLEAELHRAWTLRDALAAPGRQSVRPADYAPHMWRELEQRLLAVDRTLRTGFLLRPDVVQGRIRALSSQLELLANGKSIGDSDRSGPERSTLAPRIGELQPGRALARVAPFSLALAEVIERQGGPTVAAELVPAIARLDQVIVSGNRGDLEKFAAELKPEHERWLELRLVRRLAARPDLDWRLVQLLLEATRLGEQAAAAALSAEPWLRGEVTRADDLRVSAERQLLAAARFDREAMVVQLTEARDAYRHTLSDLAILHVAARMSHDIWHRLPDYLAWNAAAVGDALAGPTDAQILALLAKLELLDKALAAQEAAKIAAVREATVQLAAARNEVEQFVTLPAIEQLVDNIASPGEAWRMELVLESTLPSAEARRAMAAAITTVDANIASGVKSPTAGNAMSGPPSVGSDDDFRFASRAALVRRMWEVALHGVSLPDFDAFARAQEALTSRAKDQDAGTSLRSRRDLVASRLQDLMRSLRADFARGIEADLNLSSLANRTARANRLKAWEWALRLADPRQEAISAEADWSRVLADAAAYDLLAWQGDRAFKAAEDAPPQEGAFLRRVAEDYRLAAAAIPRQPPLGGGVPSQVAISGPVEISLTYLTQRDVEFSVRNTSASRQKFWVAIEADEQLVQAKSSTLRTFYSWSELNAGALADDKVATLPQRLGRLAATLELGPGQTALLAMRMTRRAASPRESHMVVRVLTADSIARHDVAVKLPPPEDIGLIVAGPVGRWSPLPAGVELLPFPNRVNSFTFQLANGKPEERKVDVEVFSLQSLPAQGIPAVPLSAADADRLRGEMSVGLLVAEARAVVLPASGELVTLALKAPEAAPVPMPVVGKSNGDDAAKKAAPTPPSDKPPPTPLPMGLLVVISDQADKRQTFRQLDIAPQRPQRYIRPQVRYRAGRERIEIRVTAQDPSLLPADGVRIHGEIAEPLPADAERQLDAVLNARQSEAEMYVEVPSSPGRVVTLRLTIDDYPRSIFYRVPTSGETSDVPEDLDTLAVRIMGLPDGTVYKPPTSSIPVELAIDAPASAQKNPPLRVEVGLDQNRDRELRGEETVLLTADRQVTASLVGVSKAGELLIEARVTDLTVNLPATSLAGGRANVLAHAVLGERDAWSAPVEIVSDAQPPRVGALELRPSGTVVIGSNVVVSALADDLGLSGVAKLEAAFDLDRSGKIGSSAPPVGGALGDDGRWTASVPTAGMSGGSYNLLVRATDKAGNASTPVRASIRLIPQELADAEKQKSNSADIIGLVTYGDEPQAAVTVNLNRDTGAPPPPKAKGKGKSKGPPPPPPLAQATTDARGQFTFPKVVPGKYTLTAEALIRNRIREADAPVGFTKPSEVQPVTLKLK